MSYMTSDTIHPWQELRQCSACGGRWITKRGRLCCPNCKGYTLKAAPVGCTVIEHGPGGDEACPDCRAGDRT